MSEPPTAWWAMFGRLAVDDDGTLFLTDDGDAGPRPIGHVGDEPEGLEAEARWLADEWRDAPSARDEHDEWMAHYRANLT